MPRASGATASRGSMTVRPLHPSDAPALAALSSKLGGAETEADWVRRLLAGGGTALGAHIGGELVAYVAGDVRVAFGASARVGWIEVFGVDTRFRGRGVGRRLADVLLARFREDGAKSARTHVPLHDRELAPFFRGLGFREHLVLCLERAL